MVRGQGQSGGTGVAKEDRVMGGGTGVAGGMGRRGDSVVRGDRGGASQRLLSLTKAPGSD